MEAIACLRCYRDCRRPCWLASIDNVMDCDVGFAAIVAGCKAKSVNTINYGLLHPASLKSVGSAKMAGVYRTGTYSSIYQVVSPPSC